jgi:hypothetical protein
VEDIKSRFWVFVVLNGYLKAIAYGQEHWESTLKSSTSTTRLLERVEDNLSIYCEDVKDGRRRIPNWWKNL